jgi:hypothetical protein
MQSRKHHEQIPALVAIAAITSGPAVATLAYLKSRIERAIARRKKRHA